MKYNAFKILRIFAKVFPKLIENAPSVLFKSMRIHEKKYYVAKRQYHAI